MNGDLKKQSELELLIEPEESIIETGQQEGPKTKRKDIQGLRGVAIIGVLIFHLDSALVPCGFLGVDVFFVISGFLITGILWRHEKLQFSDVRNFYSKRIRRIFPAYYLVILCTVCLGAYLLTDEDFRLLTLDSKWAATFAYNIHKYLQDSDYFAEIANYDFFLHTWSLAVEIQFYIIAPLMVFIAQKGAPGKGACLVLLALSLCFNCMTKGPLQFSSLPSRLWQFIIGGIAYLFPIKKLKPLFVLCAALSALPLFFIVPLNIAVNRFVVTCASAIIIAAHEHYSDEYVLGNNVLYTVGDISYSLYLIHWPVILFLKYYSNNDLLIWRDILLAAEVSVVLSYLCFISLEKYFIRNDTTKSVIFVVLVTACTFALVYNHKTEISSEIVIRNVSCDNSSGIMEQNATKTTFEKSCYTFHEVPYLPQNISEELRQRAIAQNKKFLQPQITPTVIKCNLTDPLQNTYFGRKNHFYNYCEGNGTITIFAFGNSFADREFPTLVNVFGQRVKWARMVSQSWCQPYKIQQSQECKDFVDRSLKFINETKPDVVFSLTMFLWASLNQFSNISTDVTMQRMQETINLLSSIAKVIIIQSAVPAREETSLTPMFLKSLEKNLDLNNMRIDYQDFYHKYEYAFKRIDYLQCEKCVIVYPHRIFCDSKVCRIFDPENLYSFYDLDHHYNTYAMKCIGKLYQERVDELFARGRLK